MSNYMKQKKDAKPKKTDIYWMDEIEQISVKKGNNYSLGLASPVQKRKEIPFAIICAIVFGLLGYHWRESIVVSVNTALVLLFIVLLILTARFCGLGELLGSILRAIPSMKK